MADTLGVQSARKKVSHKLYGVALCKIFIRNFYFYPKINNKKNTSLQTHGYSITHPQSISIFRTIY